MDQIQEKRKSCRKFPQLLVAREKHDNRYFHLASNEDLYRACFILLKERMERGWYGREDETAQMSERIEAKRKEVDAMKVALETCAFLPTQVVDQLNRSYRSAAGELKNLITDKRFYDAVKEVLVSKDGEEAYDLLDFRGDSQYEGISMERYS